MNNTENLKPLAKDNLNNRSSCTCPLVTIGITNYNGNNYLDQCVSSILNQSFKPIEIIIVDDNSQDGSLEKIKSLEASNENITAIFHSENSGSPDPGREEIIKAASGAYLMLVDSDDYFEDNMTIEKLLEVLQNSPELDYVYCNMLVVDREGKNIGLWNYRQYADNDLIRDTFQRGGSGVIPMKGMFKRSFFTMNNLSWYNNETAGDTLSAIIYTKHGWKYRHLDLNLLCYRQYGESFTFNLEKRTKAILKILDYIVENFGEEVYFPRIPWNGLSSLTRYNIKNYLLSQFYYELLRVYYSEWSNWSSIKGYGKENLIEALMPLRSKVLFYIEKVDSRREHFKHNVEKMLMEIESMFQS